MAERPGGLKSDSLINSEIGLRWLRVHWPLNINPNTC